MEILDNRAAPLALSGGNTVAKALILPSKSLVLAAQPKPDDSAEGIPTTAEDYDDQVYLDAVAFALLAENIDLLMYLIQKERVRLLDAQLVQQIKDIHQNNKTIEKYNEVLNRMNLFLGRIEGNEAKSTISGWSTDDVRDLEVPLNTAIKDAGVTDIGLPHREGQRSPRPGETIPPGRQGVSVLGTNVINGHATKGELDAAITKVRSMIDAAASTQTMQMQRMQMLSNRKSEAYELINSSETKRHNLANTITRP